ncbi:MAG: Imm7 family immunity protein [Bacteroidota bacterium]
MVYLTGWAVIMRHTMSTEEDHKLSQILAVEKERNFTSFFTGNLNGQLIIHFSTCRNHYSKEQHFVSLLKALSKIVGQESFGQIVIYDEEGKNGFEDKFQIYALRKGKVDLAEDTIFSPFSERISTHNLPYVL